MRGIFMSGMGLGIAILVAAAANVCYCQETAAKPKEENKEVILLKDSGKDVRITWADVEKHHGHMCIGSTLGFRSAMLALRKLSADGSPLDRKDIRVLAGVSPCGQDALSFILDIPGHSEDMKVCSGKIGFEGIRKSVFQIKSTGKGVEVILKEGIIPPDFWKLFSNRQSLEGKDRENFQKLMKDTSEKILSIPMEDLFEVNPINGNIFENLNK